MKRMGRTVLAFLLALIFHGIGMAAEPIDVDFVAHHDQSTQRYVEWLPEEFKPEATYDVLMVFHGHGSDRWQFIREARDECRGIRDVATQRGMILVSPDYRATTSWMGPKAEADVVQIIDDLRSKHRVNRVFLAGGSMGATAALTLPCSIPI